MKGSETVKRTTNCKRTALKSALGIALAAALVPGAAFASSGTTEVVSVAASVEAAQSSARDAFGQDGTGDDALVAQFGSLISQQADDVSQAIEMEKAQQAAFEAANKTLAYDPAAIEAIGTQERTGHTICCPSFSCAYADAVMDGTIHDHSYYSCSCCMWTDWGGGNSSFRSVGSDEQLLREAYDQISAGRPTVIHVAASYGEHWIALIGYENASDPDHLALDNFVALDPWDGALINASSRFTLYGDGCEHISER